jgi:hypothetical protein
MLYVAASAKRTMATFGKRLLNQRDDAPKAVVETVMDDFSQSESDLLGVTF